MPNKYVDYFYANSVGTYPGDEDKRVKITERTIQYMLDSGIPSEEIYSVLQNISGKDCLYPTELPDSLWEGSLTCKNQFYFHRQLQLISKAPTYNIHTGKTITYPFYKEMKIRYSAANLIEYFYYSANIDSRFMQANQKQNIGAVKYLLNKYNNISSTGVQTLDIILYAIDYISESDFTRSLLDIDKYIPDAVSYLDKTKRAARLVGADQIIWRSRQWM